MKTNQKLAALFLVVAGTLSTQVNAQESAVEQIVSNLVTSAISSVSAELDQQVQKVTLSASNLVSYDGSEVPAGKVSITDLAGTDNEESTQTESVKEEQEVNTDD